MAPLPPTSKPQASVTRWCFLAHWGTDGSEISQVLHISCPHKPMITAMQHGRVCSALQDEQGLTGKATEYVTSVTLQEEILFFFFVYFFNNHAIT